MGNKKIKHWRGIPELKNKNLNKELSMKEFNNELAGENSLLNNIKKLKISRRDFLKWMGFSTLSVTLSACKGKVINSIPYIVKPESINLGSANYYSSTMYDGFDFRSVVVKTREGRPIKIKSNKNAKYFNTISARVQASLLSLYDEERFKNPYIKGHESSWKEVDKYIVDKLINITKKGKQIILLTSSLPSPSTKKLISDFSYIYPTTKNVIYDNISYSKILDVNEKILGIRGFPHYDLSKTKLIISFDADFLGDWSPLSLEKSYALRRVPNKKMLKHIQIESNMTISGANADKRIPAKPSLIEKILIELYKFLKNKNTNNKIAISIGKEINYYGSNNSVIFADGSKNLIFLALKINLLIKSNTLNKKKVILTKESNDKSFQNFLSDLEGNNIGAILIHQTNPIYSLYNEKYFKNNLLKLDISVSFSDKEDETSALTDVITPSNHWLESWGDANPITGMYTLTQPTIQPIFNTRQFEDSILKWKNMGELIMHNRNNFHKNYYDYLKNFWEIKIIPKCNNINSFNEALFNGTVETEETIKENINLKYLDNKILSDNYNDNDKSLELKLYTKISIGDGRQSNNPWLQELPDPITRSTWENYITISPFDAEKLKIKNWHVNNGAMDGNQVNIITSNYIIKNVPVYIQPGQALGSIGLSLGYGSKKGKVNKKSIGVNAYKLYYKFNNIQNNIILKKSKEIHNFSCVQLQHTMVGRTSIAKETDIYSFLNKKKEIWNEKEKIHSNNKSIPVENISIWKEHDDKSGHHFNLSIDLNSCIGCSACVIACNVENNIPVVGKDEIRKSRDMHWIRIDRYYSSKENFESLYDNKKLSQKNIGLEPKMNSYLLEPEYNPKVIFQPVMCQHCNNAPCETVCPVAATTHGKQGQNMMTYNRCVGTRYCANNCPYKVRRFNWFNYTENKEFDFHMNNDLGRMVLNPDVAIRTRGVMEKCSMCIQMTQSVILNAKKDKRKIEDGEFQTACSKSCPTNAIKFGDINNKKSEINKKLKEDRSYKLLDFLGTKPNVFYQVKIRNNSKI